MTTRDAILDVTARLYAEHGWRGTTTRSIAAAAGINEVTIFRTFGSKASLMVAAIGHATAGDVAASLPETPQRLRREITEWALTQHALVAARRGMLRSCLAEWQVHPDLAPTVCHGGQLAAADLSRYLTAARKRKLIGPRGSVEAATQLFVNAIFLDAIMRDVMPAASRDAMPDTVAAFVDVILRGLGAAEA